MINWAVYTFNVNRVEETADSLINDTHPNISLASNVGHEKSENDVSTTQLQHEKMTKAYLQF